MHLVPETLILWNKFEISQRVKFYKKQIKKQFYIENVWNAFIADYSILIKQIIQNEYLSGFFSFVFLDLYIFSSLHAIFFSLRVFWIISNILNLLKKKFFFIYSDLLWNFLDRFLITYKNWHRRWHELGYRTLIKTMRHRD